MDSKRVKKYYDLLKDENLSPHKKYKALYYINRYKNLKHVEPSIEVLDSELQLALFLNEHRQYQLAINHFKAAQFIENKIGPIDQMKSILIAVELAEAYLSLDKKNIEKAEDALNPYIDISIPDNYLQYKCDLIKSRLYLEHKKYQKSLKSIKSALSSLREHYHNQISYEEYELYLEMSDLEEKGRNVFKNAYKLAHRYYFKAQSILRMLPKNCHTKENKSIIIERQILLIEDNEDNEEEEEFVPLIEVEQVDFVDQESAPKEVRKQVIEVVKNLEDNQLFQEKKIQINIKYNESTAAQNDYFNREYPDYYQYEANKDEEQEQYDQYNEVEHLPNEEEEVQQYQYIQTNEEESQPYFHFSDDEKQYIRSREEEEDHTSPQQHFSEEEEKEKQFYRSNENEEEENYQQYHQSNQEEEQENYQQSQSTYTSNESYQNENRPSSTESPYDNNLIMQVLSGIIQEVENDETNNNDNLIQNEEESRNENYDNNNYNYNNYNEEESRNENYDNNYDYNNFNEEEARNADDYYNNPNYDNINEEEQIQNEYENEYQNHINEDNFYYTSSYGFDKPIPSESRIVCKLPVPSQLTLLVKKRFDIPDIDTENAENPVVQFDNAAIACSPYKKLISDLDRATEEDNAKIRDSQQIRDPLSCFRCGKRKSANE